MGRESSSASAVSIRNSPLQALPSTLVISRHSHSNGGPAALVAPFFSFRHARCDCAVRRNEMPTFPRTKKMTRFSLTSRVNHLFLGALAIVLVAASVTSAQSDPTESLSFRGPFYQPV